MDLDRIYLNFGGIGGVLPLNIHLLTRSVVNWVRLEKILISEVRFLKFKVRF